MKNPTVGFVPKGYPQGTISQFFGENPKMYAPFGLAGHNGIDIVAEWDSPLYAVEAGVVLQVKRAPDGYGRHIRLLCGTHEWVYGHCEQQLVTVGDKVKAGQQIGTMGNTGFVVSTAYANTWWGTSPAKPTHPGTHLHLGVRLVERDKNGFSYPGSTIRIRVLNYDNGYKGCVDPMPILSGSDSTTEKQLETIGLLQKLVDLYKQLIIIKK